MLRSARLPRCPEHQHLFQLGGVTVDISFSQAELPVYVVQQLPAVPLYMEGVHLSSQGGAFLPQQGQEGQLHRKNSFPFQEHQLQCRIVVLAELKGQIPGKVLGIQTEVIVAIQLGYIWTDQIGVPIVRVGVRTIWLPHTPQYTGNRGVELPIIELDIMKTSSGILCYVASPPLYWRSGG